MHQASVTPRGKYSVYLVEDSELVRNRLCRLLGAVDGVRVVGMAAGPQASLEGIRDLAPDMVVIDIQLEGGTGLDVLRGLARAGSPAVPVVFSNALSGPVSQACRAAGAQYVLDKTTELRTLLLTVQSLAQAHSSNSQGNILK